MGVVSFKSNFNMDALRSRLDKAKEMIRDKTLDSLKEVADSWFVYSREKIGSETPYSDRTGDLLSSTGYIIIYNGELYHERFEMILDGHKGLASGKAYAREIAESSSTTGYVLICVAGEGYAGYVESKGFNVITGSSTLAKQELESLFKVKAK